MVEGLMSFMSLRVAPDTVLSFHWTKHYLQTWIHQLSHVLYGIKMCSFYKKKMLQKFCEIIISEVSFKFAQTFSLEMMKNVFWWKKLSILLKKNAFGWKKCIFFRNCEWGFNVFKEGFWDLHCLELPSNQEQRLGEPPSSVGGSIQVQLVWK